ncbi:hypothetical protein AAG570_001059 [Ranatra chinensis]|uniref:Uncharacterized protein n=1 Tax=Ranatra chinensis TaxID=642074 RepID=A0ABD0YB05_9HEMI
MVVSRNRLGQTNSERRQATDIRSQKDDKLLLALFVVICLLFLSNVFQRLGVVFSFEQQRFVGPNRFWLILILSGAVSVVVHVTTVECVLRARDDTPRHPKCFKVWFKNRRAKCRQQVKQQQQQQQQQQNGDKVSGRNSGKSKQQAQQQTVQQQPKSTAREAPSYVKPLTASPTISTPYSTGCNSSIWSPAVLETCVDQGRSSAGSGGTSLSTGAYSSSSYSSHNYTGYYSNMDYLPPPPISQPNLTNESSIDSPWPKREDTSSWYYNSTSWDRK